MNYSLLLSAIFALFLSYNPYIPIENENPQKVNSNSDSVTENDMENESLLRHVVLFNFKDSSSEEDITKVEEAFSALPEKISAIQGYEWGTNNSPEGLNKGFTHCFLVTFETEEQRAEYLPHPAHQAFIKILEPHLEDVLVVDYWSKEH